MCSTVCVIHKKFFVIVSYTLSLPHSTCSSFSLHPTDRIISTYVYLHGMYTKQLQSAVYLSSHRTQRPRRLCLILYHSRSQKLQMTNFKFFFLYNILCTVNTQHTSRQHAIVTIRLYLATCFGSKRPSSDQLRTILRHSKNSTQWDPILFTLELDKI